jgi:2-polyprenyl-3-methyl-5-hydroxy-6-metoxy-1,4-benzoquinol methylase
MFPIRQRQRQPEIMDQPDLPPAEHDQALAGLARINFFSRSARILWPDLAGLARQRPRLRLLDVATGAGDVPLCLWRWARRHSLDWQIAGCDISPQAIGHARNRACRAGAEVSFFVHDALAGPLPPADAVTCSLFLHHLDEDDACGYLRRLARPDDPEGPALVLVNDLERSWPGLLLAHVGVRLLTRSRVVHFDGPRSVEGAFTPGEALRLAESAGLSGAGVSRRWPCRWLLTWRRPS